MTAFIGIGSAAWTAVIFYLIVNFNLWSVP